MGSSGRLGSIASRDILTNLKGQRVVGLSEVLSFKGDDDFALRSPAEACASRLRVV